MTKRDTFYSLEVQIKEFRMNCPNESQENVVLVGNKVDLVEQRQVSYDDALEFCKRLNLISYFETSASSALNVDLFFFTVAMKAYEIETAKHQ